MRKRLPVKAVWDADLQGLLKNLGVLESLVVGEFTCAVCGRAVDLDNLGAIALRGEEVKVSCVEASCIRAVSSGEGTTRD
jgi:hypothetical protein